MLLTGSLFAPPAAWMPAGERIIDTPYATSTVYTYKGPMGQKVFAVNFAEGRVKG